MPALPETFGQPPEAVIQFSDVYGNIPLDSLSRSRSVPDFDSDISTQVGNEGVFVSARFPIGAWPSLGDYAGVFLWQQRQRQLESLGVTVNERSPVVAVINCAPRTENHRQYGQNGDEFYVATTENGLEIYSQAQHLRGLAARGLISALRRIPNDCGLWVPGEQFRSSTVAQARSDRKLLRSTRKSVIPGIGLDGRLAYADKFGNVRVELADMSGITEVLADPNIDRVRIKTSEHNGEVVLETARCLDDIPRGEMRLFVNPSEVATGDSAHPGYVEIVRKTDDPNGEKRHAYATLLKITAPEGRWRDFPNAWEQTNIAIDA